MVFTFKYGGFWLKKPLNPIHWYMARGCSFHVVDAFKTCQRNALHSESSTEMMSRNAIDGNLWKFMESPVAAGWNEDTPKFHASSPLLATLAVPIFKATRDGLSNSHQRVQRLRRATILPQGGIECQNAPITQGETWTSWSIHQKPQG
jgi:hypothetical protein